MDNLELKKEKMQYANEINNILSKYVTKNILFSLENLSGREVLLQIFVLDHSDWYFNSTHGHISSYFTVLEKALKETAQKMEARYEGYDLGDTIEELKKEINTVIENIPQMRKEAAFPLFMLAKIEEEMAKTS